MARVDSGGVDVMAVNTSAAYTEFDKGSAVFLSGFSATFTVGDVRAFLSWFAPVIRVDKCPQESGSFVAVFASDVHSKAMLQLGEISLPSGQTVHIKSLDDVSGSSYWSSVGDIISGASAGPLFQLATDGFNCALNTLSYSWGTSSLSNKQ